MSIHRATYQDIVDQCRRLAQQGHRLRPDQRQIAAFDADGTLWAPDVADLLWDRLLGEKALHRLGAAPASRALRGCGEEPSHDPYVDYPRLRSLASDGRCPEDVLVRVLLEGLAGMREDDVYVHAQKAIAAADAVRGAASGPAARMIASLRELDFHVIVVSGSPRWAIEVAVRPLGVAAEDIVAGQVAVIDGVLTAGVIEPLPYGKGKIQAILRRFGSVPHVSVGNAVGDLAMLEATSHLKLLLNPTEDLLRACEDGAAASTPVGLLELPDDAAAVRPPTLKSAAIAGGQDAPRTPPSGRRPRAES